MKTLHNLLFISVIAILFFFVVPAHAADPWSDSDVNQEVAYMVVHTIDWGQTRYIANNPDKFYEKNSILGSHPSTQRVDGYFLAMALVHIGVAHILPSDWRSAFQYVTIGMETEQVRQNFNIGIKVDF
jgi:hypothetical protein